MTSPAEMQAQIDALTLELRDLREQIPGAIAEGLRTFADRPAGEKGAPSLQYGIVDGVFDADGWASVLLDGQTEPVPIMMLGGLVEGERVAVLLVPPSGSLAIGMVTPQTIPPVTPGSGGGFPVGPEDDGTVTYEIFHALVGGLGELVTGATSDADPGTGAASTVVTGTSGGNNVAQAAISAATATTALASVVVLANDSNAQGATAGLSVTNDSAVSGAISVAVQNGAFEPAIALDAGSAGAISVGLQNTVLIGFYGAAPVVQAGTPTTLAQVITILQNLGLCV